MIFNAENIQNLARQTFGVEHDFSNKARAKLQSFMSKDSFDPNLFIKHCPKSSKFIIEFENFGGKNLQIQKSKTEKGKSHEYEFQIDFFDSKTTKWFENHLESEIIEVIEKQGSSKNSLKLISLSKFDYIEKIEELITKLENDKESTQFEIIVELFKRKTVFFKHIFDPKNSMSSITFEITDILNQINEFEEIENDCRNNIINCVLRFFLDQFDIFMQKQIQKVSIEKLEEIKSNLSIVKSILDFFDNFIGYNENVIINSRFYHIFEQITYFFKQLVLRLMLFDFFFDISKNSECLSSNLLSIYQNQDIYCDIYDFSNHFEGLFTNKNNEELIINKINEFLENFREIIVNENQLSVLCYLFSISDRFDKSKTELKQKIETEFKSITQNIQNLLANKNSKDQEFILNIQKSCFYLKKSRFFEELLKLIDPNFSPQKSQIVELKKFRKNEVSKWFQNFKNSLFQVKKVLNNLNLFENVFSEKISVPEIDDLISNLKTFNTLKELLSISGENFDLKLESNFFPILKKGTEIARNLIELQHWVDFYHDLVQNHSKQKLSFFVELIQNFEETLKSINAENFQESLLILAQTSVKIDEKLSILTTIEQKLLNIIMPVLDNPNGGFGYLCLAKEVSLQLESFDSQEKIKTFTIYLQHLTIRVFFAQIKLLFKDKLKFLLDDQTLKVQIRLNPETKNSFEIFPSIPDLKSRFYSKIELLFKYAQEACQGFKQSYANYLLKTNFIPEISSIYEYIEKLLFDMQAFVSKEINFELDVSNLDTKNEPIINLTVLSAEILVQKVNLLLKKIVAGKRIKSDVKSIQEIFQFKVGIHVHTSYLKNVLFEKVNIFENENAKMLKDVCSEVLKRCDFVKNEISSLLSGKNNLSISPIKMHEFLKCLSLEKKKALQFIEPLKRSLEIFCGIEFYDNFSKAVNIFLEEWFEIETVEICNPEQIAKIEAEIIIDLRLKKTALIEKFKQVIEKVGLIESLESFFLLTNGQLLESVEMSARLSKIRSIFSEVESEFECLEENFGFIHKKDDLVEFLEKFIPFKNRFLNEDHQIMQKHVEYWSYLYTTIDQNWNNFWRQNFKSTLSFFDKTIGDLSSDENKYSKSLVKIATNHKEFFLKYLVNLSGESYQVSDWMEALKIISFSELSPSDLKCLHLIEKENEIRHKINQIKQINTRIIEQNNIRTMLKEIENWKSNTEFTFSDHLCSEQTIVHIITNWEEISEMINEFNFQIQVIIDSPFKNSFFDQIGILKNFFSQSENALHSLRDLQKKLLYLDPIFNKSRLSKKVIDDFSQTKTRIKNILSFLFDRKLINSILHFNDLENFLKCETERIAMLQRSLYNFLELKRVQFPRLYLLGEEDLIELIAFSQDETYLRFHLKKLFPAVESVKIIDDSGICQASSEAIDVEKEVLTFIEPIPINEVELSSWLLNLKSVMTKSLQNELTTYNFEGIGTLEFFKNLEMNIDKPLQILILIQEIAFSHFIFETGFLTNFKSLQSAYTDFITKLSKKQLQKGSALISEKCRQIIMHTIRKVASLKELQINFQDQSWLIYKLITYRCAGIPLKSSNNKPLGNVFNIKKKDDLAKSQIIPINSLNSEIMIEIGGSSLKYSWEYQGLRAPLVYTQITDRIFLTIAQCLKYKQNTNLTGLAGTGKTETAKFFGAFLGRNVLIFNCDESMSNNTISKIFKGFVSEEIIACFDEFNRLNQSQLSIASQIIQSVQNVLKSNGSLTSGEGLPLINQNCGLIVTMNPKVQGYGARFVLPQNLKNMFRVVNVANPSEKNVFEVLIFAEGCEDYEILAEKLITFFKRGRQEFSCQRHYDWSLRKVKSVIATFRNTRNSNSSASKMNEFCLIRSLETNVVSILNEQDIQIYELIMNAVFGSTFQSYNQMILEEKCSKMNIDDSLQENDIYFKDVSIHGKQKSWLKEKVRILEELLKARDAVIIFGKSETGKSLIWKVFLQNALNCGHVVVNPKFADKRLFLGYINETTGVFIDGFFTQIIRKTLKEKNQTSKFYVIFDSEIDPEWIESLNSMLDDNRLLSLPNGERIKVPSFVKFIFEARCIGNASPATLSRLGILNIDSSKKVTSLVFQTNTGSQIFVGGSIFEIISDFRNTFSISGNVDEKKDVLISNKVNCSKVMIFNKKEHFSRITLKSEKEVPLTNGINTHKNAHMVDFDNAYNIIISLFSDLLKSNFEQVLSNDIFLLFCSNFQHLVEIQKQNGFIIEDLIVLSIYLFSSRKLFKDFSKQEDLSIFTQFFSKTTKSLISDENIEVDVNLYENCIISGKLLFLTSEKLSDLKISETKIDNICQEKLFNSIKISCTNKMTQTSIVVVFKDNFKIIERNGNMFMETGDDKKRTVIILKDFESISKDKYGFTEMYEFIYNIINYGFFIDENAVRINVSNTFSIVVLLGLNTIGFCQKIPVKLSKLGVIHFLDYQKNTSTFDNIDNMFFEVFEKGKSILNKKSNFDEIIRTIKKVNEKITEALISCNYKLKTDISWKSLIMYLSLIDFKSFSEVNIIIHKLLIYNILIEIDDKEVYKNITSCIKETINSSITKELFCLPNSTLNQKMLQTCDRKQFQVYNENLITSYRENFSNTEIALIGSQEKLFELLMTTFIINELINQSSHMILFNGSGIGRKLCLQLASISTSFQIIFFNCSSESSCVKEFSKLLNKTCSEILIENKKTNLIIYENQIADVEVFDEIVRFLKTLSCKGIQKQELENWAKKNQEYNDFSTTLSEFIKNKLTKNLNIILILDETRFEKKEIFEKYPALMTDMKKINCSNFINSNTFEEFLEKEMSKSISKESSKTITTLLSNNNIFKKISDAEIISFSKFINLIQNSIIIYNSKLLDLKKKLTFFEQGVQKLNDAKNKVQELADEAEIKQQKVAQKSLESEASLKKVAELYQGSLDKRRELELAEEQIIQEEKKIEIKREEVNTKLASVLPTLENAKMNVKKVSRSNIDELRMLKNVPDVIIHVFTVLLKLMNFADVSFSEAKKLLSKKSILDEILTLDFKSISKTNYDFVRQFIKEKGKSFDVQSVYYASQAAGPIAEFINALMQCKTLYFDIEPLDAEKNKIESQISEIRSKTVKLREFIQKVDKGMAHQKLECATKMGETEMIKKELQEIQNKLLIAKSLMDSLSGENERWKEQIVKIKAMEMNLMNLSLFSSFLINLNFNQIGKNGIKKHKDDFNENTLNLNVESNKTLKKTSFFTQTDFEQFKISLKQTLDPNDIFNLQEFLGSEKLLHQIFTSGIFDNSRTLKNIYSLIWSKNTPFLIDPTNSILQFLKNNQTNEYIIVGSHDKTLLQKISTALKLGKLLIIDNFTSDFPPFLYPVIKQMFNRKISDSLEVELCGKFLSVSPNFRLVLTNQFLEEINSVLVDYTNIIDNSHGIQTLQNYFINFILERKNPEMLEKRIVNMNTQRTINEELGQLENDVLEKVKSLDDNLLENQQLIESLKTTKTKSSEITKNLHNLKEIAVLLTFEQQKYSKISEFLGIAFLRLEELAKTSHFYRFSLDFFNFCIERTFENVDNFLSFEEKDYNEILNLFSSSFCVELAKNIGIGLKSEDRPLLFMILLLLDTKNGFLASDLKIMTFLLNDIFSEKNNKNKSKQEKSQNASKIENLSKNNKSKNDKNIDFMSEKCPHITFSTWFLLSETQNSFLQIICEHFDVLQQSARNEPEFEKSLTKIISTSLTLTQKLILICIFKNDRLFNFIIQTFENRFGVKLSEIGFKPTNFSGLFSRNTKPVIIKCEEGVDASADLIILLKNLNLEKDFDEVICGENNANQILEKIALTTKKVIVLKNFHLCPKIISDVVRLSNETNGKNLKLIILTEEVDFLPVSFISNAVKITFEKTQGLIQNMQKNYSLLTKDFLEKMKPCSANLVFCTSILHILFIEREKMEGFGWSKKYDFSWTDFINAINFLADIDSANIKDSNLIYQQMLINSIYGSKVDSEVDQEKMKELVGKYLKLNDGQKTYLPNSVSFGVHVEKFARLQNFSEVDLGFAVRVSSKCMVWNNDQFLDRLKNLFEVDLFLSK